MPKPQSFRVRADIDDGYGNAISVREAVLRFEQAGVAAIQLEDQQLPKKCGSMQGKKLVSSDEMVQNIRAAVEAGTNRDLFIIARTDATDIGNWDEDSFQDVTTLLGLRGVYVLEKRYQNSSDADC